MNIAPIHPFPARMAPEIAIAQLGALPANSLVLDPMMGSGTVLRHAVALGHRAIGFDMDPLAVVMSRVWSTPVSNTVISQITRRLETELAKNRHRQISLPWIDEDAETRAFVQFWFGKKQRDELRRIAFVISKLNSEADDELKSGVDILRIALSRIIVTKSKGASLGWDVSHSRPHKVAESSDFEVVPAFWKSQRLLCERLTTIPSNSRARASGGDARVLQGMRRDAVDLVLTSPPYLNAIDYIRGHKLSLVWQGYSIGTLRSIRRESVGAERRASAEVDDIARSIQIAMVNKNRLRSRDLSMVERYSADLANCLRQTARVLKPGCNAIYVVGNSCIRDTFVRNSRGVIKAAEAAGLVFVREAIRQLPAGNRYLPIPTRTDSALGKRMRTESILVFKRPA